MAIYMKVPFAEGSVTAVGYKGWVHLSNMSFEVEKDVSMEGGSGKNRKTGHARFSQFSIDKRLEDSSGGFMQQAAQSVSGHNVIIAICTAGDSPREFARFELEDAVISSYELNASEDIPTEKITLTYSAITATYTPHDPLNTAKSPIKVMQKL